MRARVLALSATFVAATAAGSGAVHAYRTASDQITQAGPANELRTGTVLTDVVKVDNGTTFVVNDAPVTIPDDQYRAVVSYRLNNRQYHHITLTGKALQGHSKGDTVAVYVNRATGQPSVQPWNPVDGNHNAEASFWLGVLTAGLLIAAGVTARRSFGQGLGV